MQSRFAMRPTCPPLSILMRQRKSSLTRIPLDRHLGIWAVYRTFQSASLMSLGHHPSPRKSRVGADDSVRRDLLISPIAHSSKKRKRHREHHHDCGAVNSQSLFYFTRPPTFKPCPEAMPCRGPQRLECQHWRKSYKGTREKKVHLYVMRGFPCTADFLREAAAMNVVERSEVCIFKQKNRD